MMRAMPLEFPDDPGCDTLDRQYMLGDALLVAPVFSPDGVVDYYLPAGRWTHLITGRVVEGGRWVREQHGYLSLPLMARPNSILPVGANEQRPDYEYADGVTFHVFELQDRALSTTAAVSASVPTLQGDVALTIEISRAGRQIHVSTRGASSAWRVLLRGVTAVQSVEGGAALADALGTLVVPAPGATRLSIVLG